MQDVGFEKFSYEVSSKLHSFKGVILGTLTTLLGFYRV